MDGGDLLIGADAALVGLVSGVLSGMFGIGGAVITTPAIRALGATPIDAVGSTVPAILPGAVAGSIRYAKEGAVDWRVGITCGVSGTALAVAGAWSADLVDAHLLMVITAGLLLFSGWSLVRGARRLARPAVAVAAPAAPDLVVPAPVDAPPTLPALVGVGAVAGYVAGLLGVGGGIIMMPAFTGVLRLPVKVAVPASLVAVAIFSVPALVTHWALGHIDWTYALPLALGVVPGARLGARFTLGASEITVRALLGAFLVLVALVYGGRELGYYLG